MPDIEMAAAIWNRDTHENQFDVNTNRIKALKGALQACERQFGRILKPQQRIKGIFVAPEYFFAAPLSGRGDGTGSFHLRGVDQDAKDHIVAQLIAVSKLYSKVLLIPGTIAWWKPLNRRPQDEFKRDRSTNERTNVLKTQTREHNVKQALYDNYMAGGSRGGRIPTDLLKAKVRNELLSQKRLLNSPSLPGSEQSYQVVSNDDVLQEVYRILNDDSELIQYGPINTLVRGVPSQGESQYQVDMGTVDKVLKNTAYVLLNGTIRFKYNKANDFHEALSENGSLIFCPGTKSGYTSIDGIDIGLEICLDHAVGQLTNNTSLPGSGAPHLHIITSASVQPKGAHVSVRQNGYLIHASSNPDWAFVQKNSSTGWQHAELMEELRIGGDPLQIFKIKIAVP
jgi:hypothetical protein